jgi:hypothetical protein
MILCANLLVLFKCLVFNMADVLAQILIKLALSSSLSTHITFNQ